MTEWRELTLGDLITVKHGYAFKGEYFAPTGDEIVLTPGNFPVGGGLQFRDSKERYYTGPYPEEFRLSPGDLLVVMTDLKQDAPILGSPAFVPSEPPVLHNQRLGLVRLKPAADVDIRYLFYLLLSDHTRSQLRATATGSTVRHTAPERIYRVTARVPPLSEQRTIGSVLGALDDLIENNRWRIDVLEQMALAIYREWFVRFRYPGHEDAIFVDSAFGAIPEGWRIERLNAKKMPFRLTKPRVRAYDGVKRYLATADCTGFHRLQAGESLPYHGLPTRAQLQPAPDTVWFGRMAGYKKVLAFPTGSDEIGSFVLSSGFACIECDPGWFGFVLATVLDDSFESTKGRFATGATQVSLTDAGANRTPWLVPPPSVTISFERAVRPLYMEALRLLRTSESVLALRACLLPKLVTGQLDVSHLDLDAVEASVA